ncbi:magnesium chelatase subunit D [Lentibacter algarum]|uniref:magnesium chelatase subunit D n=1 Tax=Lentibacter algarum TaxID=576131 RepID=UPI003BB0B6BB
MTPWNRAVLALSLAAIDPRGLNGVIIRARPSAARDALMQAARSLRLPHVRLHPVMTKQVLDGDVDVSATLGSGTVLMQRGLLARGPSMLVLPMAERASVYLSARLGQALDASEGHLLLALDESAENDEALPARLADRCAFEVILDDIALGDIRPPNLPDDIASLQKAARRVIIPPDIIEQLVMLAVSSGITSLRAPSFALRAAGAHAALNGRTTLDTDDISAAVMLVFAHRATQLPETSEQNQPPPPQDQHKTQNQNDGLNIPDDLLVDAINASLPAGLLDRSSAGKGKTGAGSGAKRAGARRGRPLPAGTSGNSDASVDLLATLRAAVPWQTLRKRGQPQSIRPVIYPSDLRNRRYETLSDRLLIFVVDASGSAAMARLSEAKGAVELLLAGAYARRDHVALITFRGTKADVLLPPTRSLVQTKRRLAELPGGGATPLASGLSAAFTMAQTASRKGMTPTVITLTDGRANIALDGQPNRPRAASDAQDIARKLANGGIDALVIDTTLRPDRNLRALADTMRAKYIALPRTDAQSVSAAVSASLVG